MEVSYFYSSKPRRTTRRLQTLLQAIEELQEHPLGNNVVILPPDAGDRAVDSDVEETVDNQLNEECLHEPAGEVELEINRPESDNDDTDTGECVEEPARKKSKQADEKPNWRRSAKFKNEILALDLQPLLQRYPLLATCEPADTWNMIMDRSILESTADQSTLYTHRDKNTPDFSLTVSELHRFMGILILSGYHVLPEESHYWNSDPDLGVSVVSDCFTLKRFLQIKRFIHLADNNSLQQGNKVAKVSAVYDKINENLLQFGVFHNNLSIDDSTVPYFGRIGAKMYIKGKPIRYGYMHVWH